MLGAGPGRGRRAPLWTRASSAPGRPVQRQDWLLLVDRCRPASAAPAPSSPSSRARHRPDAVSPSARASWQPAHGRLPCERRGASRCWAPATTPPTFGAARLLRSPPWRYWTFWTGDPEPGQGEGAYLRRRLIEANGQAMPGVPPGETEPHDRGEVTRWANRGWQPPGWPDGLLVSPPAPPCGCCP